MTFDQDSEFDSFSTIDTIVSGLRAAGHSVQLVEATSGLPQWFLTHHVDLVFNIAEGTRGEHRESQVPAVLESLEIPFTGSSSLTLALALDKAKTKRILISEGIPTPPWQLLHSVRAALHEYMEFPLIVKPNREGSAKGIWRESVVGDENALRRQVDRVLQYYRQEALVEEFIHGRELTVGVLGDEVLPILEIDFAPCRISGEYFYSWRMKEFQGNEALGLSPKLFCPARLDSATTRRIQDLALRAHQTLGCSDFSRTDIRLRADGKPFVLEINPLPGLNPLESNFPLMARAAGFSHEMLIQRIVELAIHRWRDHRSRCLPQEPSGALGMLTNTVALKTPGASEQSRVASGSAPRALSIAGVSVVGGADRQQEEVADVRDIPPDHPYGSNIQIPMGKPSGTDRKEGRVDP